MIKAMIVIILSPLVITCGILSVTIIYTILKKIKSRKEGKHAKEL